MVAVVIELNSEVWFLHSCKKKWCRAISVVPETKHFEPLPNPPPPKPIPVQWGPLIPVGMDKLSIVDELETLHHTFRKMEASQRHFHDESELVLRRQKVMLETLQLDNMMTQDKIDLFYPEDYAEEMKRLNAECAMWIDKIDAETKRVEELEHAIATLYADEYSSKKAMGGVHAASEHNRATQIHIHILENRVHKAMVDLTTIQWHNKKMQDEMQSLRVEHALFDELHNKMEIELLEKGEEIQKIIDGSYELFEERHDYQKLISEILTMMEEGDAYENWRTYGTWKDMDGRPLAETALASDKEREDRMKQKRPTLPLTNDMDLKKMFVIEGTEAREKFISKPHTKRYERLIEVKAFTLTQNNLDLEQEMVDEVLPALVHAREYHAQLVRDVQDLNAQIEDAMRYKLGRFLDGDDFEDVKNDFLDIIRALKRQIFQVFKEAGCTNWDPDVVYGVDEGVDVADESMEMAISRLFIKTEEFITEMSVPLEFGPVTKDESTPTHEKMYIG
ncbi:unnamed protein product [Sphagnum jensenii]|uniref:ODAD1 central coiled coil region domain-containing protein n=1 Tax=Sphagnum jensenii TaxID=128206 RepID=A0ABP1A1F4_9BRYO